MRILLLALFGYLIYHFLKRVFRNLQQSNIKQDEPIDQMVQDPYCKTYIPLKSSLKININGINHYFCSKKCAEEFKKNNSSKD